MCLLPQLTQITSMSSLLRRKSTSADANQLSRPPHNAVGGHCPRLECRTPPDSLTAISYVDRGNTALSVSSAGAGGQGQVSARDRREDARTRSSPWSRRNTCSAYAISDEMPMEPGRNQYQRGWRENTKPQPISLRRPPYTKSRPQHVASTLMIRFG
jgi:hypothetical protein